jgi:hypothetical protein
LGGVGRWRCQSWCTSPRRQQRCSLQEDHSAVMATADCVDCIAQNAHRSELASMLTAAGVLLVVVVVDWLYRRRWLPRCSW